jgi:dihydrolipoamide dehydrogenase
MYDLAVIGAGWAGFNAALRAKELGLKTCLIERSHVGGTCLNSGCIPTKALIQSAKIYSLVKMSADFGIEISGSSLANFAKIQERKESLIQQLRSGMKASLKDVDFISGDARFLSSTDLKVGEQVIKAKYSIIASGSEPSQLNSLKFDGKKIISSDDILDLKEIPASLLIVGGGVIGCEFASLFSIFKARVAIVEKLAQILPGLDSEIARKITSIFKKKGIKINTLADAATVDLNSFDLVLVCVGRASRTGGLGLEKTGVRLERGRIAVDPYLKTSEENIYAAGDCTGKIMLAHYAAYQGRIAAENIARPDSRREAGETGIPNCIFTDPEIASVGISEEEAKDKALDIQISKFDFLGSGMARILDETEGLIKIISDTKTKKLLGGSIIGPRATELIAILGLAFSSGLTITQIKETIFAHPTLSESIHEALK